MCCILWLRGHEEGTAGRTPFLGIKRLTTRRSVIRAAISGRKHYEPHGRQWQPNAATGRTDLVPWSDTAAACTPVVHTPTRGFLCGFLCRATTRSAVCVRARAPRLQGAHCSCSSSRAVLSSCCLRVRPARRRRLTVLCLAPGLLFLVEQTLYIAQCTTMGVV
jgi:hypothetical protein